MAFVRMRRTALAVAAGAALLLAGCGSGTIESQLHPVRMVAFGDAFSDMGQMDLSAQTGPTGQSGSRFTVNDGAVNNWLQEVAGNFNLPFGTTAIGGTDYAWGNARITAKPDAAGDSTTPTIQEQVDSYLASNVPGTSDLLFISGGTSDIIVEMQKVLAGTETAAQMQANVTQAGTDLATQAKRLVAAGATHVVVLGVYDLSKTPWATAIAQQSVLAAASLAFNNAVELALVDQGANMLFVDAAFEMDLMVNSPASFSMTDSTSVICSSVDPGPGIGIGAGQVNSRLCTPATVPAGLDWNKYVFADAVYPAPQAQRTFGTYVYSRVTARW